jgi:hypothetical protein
VAAFEQVAAPDAQAAVVAFVVLADLAVVVPESEPLGAAPAAVGSLVAAEFGDRGTG